jgi:Aspartyl protease
MNDFYRLDRSRALTFDHLRAYSGIGGRPQATVTFRNPAPELSGTTLARASVLVTIDSGADITVISNKHAAALHVDLETLKPTRTMGGAGGTSYPVYQKTWLEALLCGNWVPLPVLFYANDTPRGLLGRAGAFEAIRIAFVHGRQVMYAASEEEAQGNVLG